MIPDVSKMQVKVGIHESKVEQLRVGMPARVQLQDMTLEGEVDDDRRGDRPAGWWTGNMVKYDTIIKLQQRPGLKPGMSAVVDIVLASTTDVLKIPVAAIVEGDEDISVLGEDSRGNSATSDRTGRQQRRVHRRDSGTDGRRRGRPQSTGLHRRSAASTRCDRASIVSEAGRLPSHQEDGEVATEKPAKESRPKTKSAGKETAGGNRDNRSRMHR